MEDQEVYETHKAKQTNETQEVHEVHEVHDDPKRMKDDELFVALHVITQLKPDDKLAVYAGHVTIHSASTLFNWLVSKLTRTLWPVESRTKSFRFIKSCIEQFQHRVQVWTTQESHDPTKYHVGKRYHDLAQKVSKSLEMHQNTTYKNDANMYGNLTRERNKLQDICRSIEILLHD